MVSANIARLRMMASAVTVPGYGNINIALTTNARLEKVCINWLF
jgi:hypothetical protein